MTDRKKTPNFRITKELPHRLFLQCSDCLRDIKEIKPKESIHVTRAYYCDECDPGVIVLNPSTKATRKKSTKTKGGQS